jgi:type II secretory ATPase GspE/PulE/Tfp pilus assembly ATPase PilB-like protein
MDITKSSQWYRTDVLAPALNRVFTADKWLQIWGDSPALFLEWAAQKASLSPEALFTRLLADREAEESLGFSPVAIDPAAFPGRGHVPPPGQVGAYFLPLWVQDGVLTCVSHTPLLLPSEEALQVLAASTNARSVSVVYCLPWAFDTYRTALQKRHPNPPPERSASGRSLMTLVGQVWVDLEGFHTPMNLCEVVPSRFQRRFEVVPVYGVSGHWVTLAAEKIPDMFTRTEISGMLPPSVTVRYVLADPTEIRHAISEATSADVDMNRLASRLKEESGGESAAEAVERIDFHAIHQRSVSTENAPAVTLLQTLLLHAVRHNASDLHIARNEGVLNVEYRLDDWKYPYPDQIPVSFADPIIARIKVLAELDLQRQNVPQMGRFVIDVTKIGEVEVRVTVMPTIYGDAATLRFARRKDRLPSLVELGMEEHEAGILKRIIDGSFGLGLVVGPTGSGKSTTLYSLLATIHTDKYEVLCAEDPVERFLPGTKQTNIGRGLTYAAYLAGALRADPDYIHIGETRTPDTAEQVLKAAETGHVVLTTLHTHQAAAAPGRLFGLGVEPYMLADTLMGVVAQQLLPKICPHCEESVPAPRDETLRLLGVDPSWFQASASFREGRGCTHCRGRGARGRMLIAEGFYADATIQELILKRRPMSEIREAQKAQGGYTLLQQAVRAAAAGKVPLSVALSLGSSALS